MPTLPLPALASIEPSFHGAEQVLLGLDFDGTLVPIQERPETCHLTVSQRAILERCAALPGVTACIISGRSLADIERRLQLPGWHYAGNHGLEIRLGNKRFIEPHAEQLAPVLQQLADQLEVELRVFPGVWVQNKTYTLSVHYRQAASELHSSIQQAVEKITEPHRAQGTIHLRSGKMVQEIRPAISWNKGDVIAWIRQQLVLPEHTRLIYAGDDVTDEDVFAKWPAEVTIHVGSSLTLARYRLADTEGVYRFLDEWLLWWPRCRNSRAESAFPFPLSEQET